ncbi:MAG: CpsD/CapB family tyrosine-protein kinase [Terriglobia bacterium]
MSRIHDALTRRATDEKSKSLTPGVEPATWEAPADSAASGPPITASGGLARDLQGERPADSEVFQAISDKCPQSEWSPDPAMILFYGEEFRTRGSEEFRTLRSRLELVRQRKPLQKLLVTSPMPGEGKSFLAANLAQVIVWQRERHVLLIDADLRSSRLHRALGVPAAPGLSDYLAGKVDEFAVVKRGPLDNFFFVPGGAPVANASELIANGRFQALLNRLAVAFDWIIIDSPPVIPIADARLMAQSCDGVLLVLQADETSAGLAQQAYREFRGAPFVGVVLNQVDPHSTYGYDYYYPKDTAVPAKKKAR